MKKRSHRWTFRDTRRVWRSRKKRRFGSVELVQNELFFALFGSFAGTAFHVEVQDSYHTPDEAGPFELFLTQQHDDLAWHQPWLNLVRNVTKAGNSIQR